MCYGLKTLLVFAKGESVLILLLMKPFQTHAAIPDFIPQINNIYLPCIRICNCYTIFSLVISCSFHYVYTHLCIRNLCLGDMHTL